jgi:deoxyadenosine/deoxycytidine kinase
MNLATTHHKYIVIEGIIGSGKTTLCRELGRRTDILGENPLVQFEPAEGENPYLDAYYAHPADYAFKMQVYLLGRRYRAHLAAQSLVLSDTCSVVSDRSYFGDRCFAELQLSEGYFSAADFATYLTLHKDMQRDILYPSAFIYIRTPVSLAMERIGRRMSEIAGRSCECAISHSYMNKLYCSVERMIAAMSRYTDVIELNALADDGSERPVSELCAEAAERLKNLPVRYDAWQGCQ